MATKKARTVKKEDRVPSGSRRPLSKMSDAHREHVTKWEPHLENLKAEFAWVAVSRFSGQGDGPHYVAIKRGPKDFAIVAYDTSDPKPITKRNVMDEGFTTSTGMMEAFKGWRKSAREERAADKANRTPAKTKAKATKKAPAKKAPAKAAAKKVPAKKAAPKKVAAKKPVRRRKPAGASES